MNLIKAKPIGGNKFGTRKSKNCIRGNVILPRSNGLWFRQCDSSRSRRRQQLRNFANRKVRRDLSLHSGGAYKKLYNLKWFLD